MSAPPGRVDVSLVIPVYDEIASLPGLYAEIVDALEPRPESWEAVFIDDGSRDGSSAWLDRLAASDDRVRVLHFAANAGQSAAFHAGFRAARGEVVVTLDADGQNPPAEIPRLLDALGDGIDLVAGYRARRRDSLWRRVQSRIANRIRNALSGETIRDTGCSLKAFRRRYLLEIPLFRGNHRFLPTLCRIAGAERVVEVPVAHRPRRAGRSKYGMWSRALPAFVDLLGVRWLKSRAVRYTVTNQSTK